MCIKMLKSEQENKEVYNIIFGSDEFLLQVFANLTRLEYEIIEDAMDKEIVVESNCCVGENTKCTLCNLSRAKIKEISQVSEDEAKLYYSDTEWKSENLETFEKILEILIEKL